ncbi:MULTISPECIES: hypothetical protein [unclassified Coleofasciculus]|uniref:hypothetical protein n=1 Tax=unclassified Coleofasciculus TaxID=2692782 RepID=UPI001880AD6E|nr:MULTISPECIES: hypothetical protein [unclassified Coleofasciculus]MBE9129944.1 hypothetical protein [Coleofasciculus sp. LEGE 07081]MBE9152360.1 hypothetical protein [Coleofasciculus sp. LEGE 07092]
MVERTSTSEAIAAWGSNSTNICTVSLLRVQQVGEVRLHPFDSSDWVIILNYLIVENCQSFTI